MRRTLPTSKGPFRADQIRSGDPYELSNGHAVQCMTAGGREGRNEGRQEGQQQALREAVLAVLQARGLPVDDAARSALAAVDDPVALRRHLTRAATASTTDEVFAGE